MPPAVAYWAGAVTVQSLVVAPLLRAVVSQDRTRNASIATESPLLVAAKTLVTSATIDLTRALDAAYASFLVVGTGGSGGETVTEKRE